MHIADVIRGKGADVVTIGPSATVGDLIALIAGRNIGALPVVDDGQLVGIVSERDVVRQLHESGSELLAQRVSEIMTTQVTTCSPGDSVVDLARVMTERRFRHLPVVVDGELRGIVSIGYIVTAPTDIQHVWREHVASFHAI